MEVNSKPFDWMQSSIIIEFLNLNIWVRYLAHFIIQKYYQFINGLILPFKDRNFSYNHRMSQRLYDRKPMLHKANSII